MRSDPAGTAGVHFPITIRIENVMIPVSIGYQAQRDNDLRVLPVVEIEPSAKHVVSDHLPFTFDGILLGGEPELFSCHTSINEILKR